MLEYLEEVADALAGMYIVTETDDNKLKIEKDRDNLTFYISKGSNEETGELDAFVLNDGTKNSYFDNLDEIIDFLMDTYELDPGDEARPSIRRESKLKTEAIYLVTPNEGDSKIIDLDEIEKAVSEITDTVKSNGNDATSFAIEEAENEQPSDVNVNSDENDIKVVDISEEPEQFEIVDTLDIEPDANSTLLDAASISGSDITSDVQADGIVEIVDETIVNGPMFTLAEQLMSAYFTVSSLHRNLTGKEWFEGHETLDNYAKELNLIIDEVIEQNIALGGIEPSVQQAITAFPTEAICGRDKVESYRIVRSLFNSIITLMEECKSGIPADVISKIEESQNFFRKEAEYKLARTVLGESKLMTVEEMKKERILEGKLAQVKVDAKKDALDTGDDQYIYQDGEEVYYTDESPKKNPKLFDRVTLIGKFITDMKDGKMVVNYYTEGKDIEEVKEISKFKRRLNEEKFIDYELVMANYLVDNYSKSDLENKNESEIYELVAHHVRFDDIYDANGNKVYLSSSISKNEDGELDINLDINKIMSYVNQIYLDMSKNESKDKSSFKRRLNESNNEGSAFNKVLKRIIDAKYDEQNDPNHFNRWDDLGLNKEDFVNIVLQDGYIPIDEPSQVGQLYYKVCKIDSETSDIDNYPNLKKQLEDEGKYGYYQPSFTYDPNSKVKCKNDLGIYGRKDKYVTTWFRETAEESMKADLKSEDTNLVNRAKKYIDYLIKKDKSKNENKIGETEIQDSMDYVGTDNNPELEEISGDKISFEQFKKDHKDEIDICYKNTYGEEINKDLYNALADYMYNDSLTGNVQTKEDHTDIIDETSANKELVNDAKNESYYEDGYIEVNTDDYEISHGEKPSFNIEGKWFFATYKGDIKDFDAPEVIDAPLMKLKDAAKYAIKEFKNRGLKFWTIYVKG